MWWAISYLLVGLLIVWFASVGARAKRERLRWSSCVTAALIWPYVVLVAIDELVVDSWRDDLDRRKDS